MVIAKRRSILAVDDAPMVLRLLSDILKDCYDIILSKDGEQAIRLAKEYLPDLVLLDVIMPNISGFDVLKALKSDPATAGIPVILVTGSDNENTEADGYTAGAIDFIKKPFIPSVIRHKVNLILNI